MTKEEAIQVAQKAIYAATFRDSGSGGRVTVAHITADGIVGKPASPHRHNKQLQVFSCQVIERHPQVQMLPNTMEVPTIGFQRFFADPLRGF